MGRSLNPRIERPAKWRPADHDRDPHPRALADEVAADLPPWPRATASRPSAAKIARRSSSKPGTSRRASSLTSLFARGHALLVGVPGAGQDAAREHRGARITELSFRRIQFADMMPSDITGTDILQDEPRDRRRKFAFIAGPLFIHHPRRRDQPDPYKTQAALLGRCRARPPRGIEDRIALPARSSSWRRRTRSSRRGRTRSRGPARPVHAQYPRALPDGRRGADPRATGEAGDVLVTLSAEQIVAIRGLVRRVPVPAWRCRRGSLRPVGTIQDPGDAAGEEVRLLGRGKGLGPGVFDPRREVRGAGRARRPVRRDGRRCRHIAEPVLRHRIVTTFHAEGRGSTRTR